MPWIQFRMMEVAQTRACSELLGCVCVLSMLYVMVSTVLCHGFRFEWWRWHRHVPAVSCLVFCVLFMLYDMVSTVLCHGFKLEWWRWHRHVPAVSCLVVCVLSMLYVMVSTVLCHGFNLEWWRWHRHMPAVSCLVFCVLFMLYVMIPACIPLICCCYVPVVRYLLAGGRATMAFIVLRTTQTFCCVHF